jgi:hypothetical protein
MEEEEEFVSSPASLLSGDSLRYKRDSSFFLSPAISSKTERLLSFAAVIYVNIRQFI